MRTGESEPVAEVARLAKTALIAELEQQAEAVRGYVRELTDEQLWFKPLVPGNTIGHLLLHLTGNLNHFIGAQVGGSGYVRDREREFTETNHPSRETLLRQFDDAVATFRRVVEGLNEAGLCAPHPEARFGTVLVALVKVTAHFALHRGQISYLVRLVKC